MSRAKVKLKREKWDCVGIAMDAAVGLLLAGMMLSATYVYWSPGIIQLVTALRG